MNQIEFADAAAIQFIHSASHHLVFFVELRGPAIGAFIKLKLMKSI